MWSFTNAAMRRWATLSMMSGVGSIGGGLYMTSCMASSDEDREIQDEYDVGVIGGGVVGLSVARECAVRGYRVVLLEREDVVSAAASSGNSGLGCTGYDAPVGSLERQLLRRSIQLHPTLYRSFGLSYEHVRKCGSLVVAWTPEQLAKLPEVLRENEDAGDREARFVSREELRTLEPRLGYDALGAVLCPREAVVEPWLVPIGYCESTSCSVVCHAHDVYGRDSRFALTHAGARLHGADIRTGTEVVSASRDGNGVWCLETRSSDARQVGRSVCNDGHDETKIPFVPQPGQAQRDADELLLLSTTTGRSAVVETNTGLSFHSMYDEICTLKAIGCRKKYNLFSVYAVGVYADLDDVVRALRLKMYRTVDSSTMADAIKNSLRPRIRDERKLSEFASVFSQKVSSCEANSSVCFDMRSDSDLDILVNGEVVSTVSECRDLRDALVSLYVGDDTVTAMEDVAIKKSDRNVVRARVVVNCAGLFGDRVEQMRTRHCEREKDSDVGFRVVPRKGQFVVYQPQHDSDLFLNHIIEPVATQFTKGVIVWSTIYGNVIVGPTATNQESRADRSTDEETVQSLMAHGRKAVRGLDDETRVVGTYAGLRPSTEHRDYQIRAIPSQAWVCVGGIRSTGLTASSGIGEYVGELVDAVSNALSVCREEDRVSVDDVYVPPTHASGTLVGVTDAATSGQVTSRDGVAPKVHNDTVPTLEELAKDYRSRGDGTVTVYGRPFRVTHPISSFGMETLGCGESDSEE